MWFNRIIVTSLLALTLATTLWAQDDWHTYPFRGISALVSQEQELYRSTSPKGDIVVSAKPFPAKTRVIFTGSKRQVMGHTSNFIKLWFETRGAPVENAGKLVEEYLFKEKDQEYWIPVLKSVTPSMDKGLKAGDEIVIYYFYLGGFDGRSLAAKSDPKEPNTDPNIDGIRWMFVVEKFEKPDIQFKLQTLASVIASRSDPGNKTEDIWYDPDSVKAKLRVRFTGEVREVSGQRKRLRDLWFEKMGFPDSASALMQFEAQFVEGDKEYWIAIRDRTLDQIKENVKKGDSLYLNTILAGGIREKGKIDWFFMAGEYSTF